MHMRPFLRDLLLLATVVGTCHASLAQDDEAPPAIRTFQPHQVTVPMLEMPAVDTPVTDTARTLVRTHRPGAVTVVEDPRISQLMRSHAENKMTIKGYRVQIFLGDRKTAEETKRSFLQKYPDTPAYLSWLAPNFRLRVGDLRTRLEAEHLLQLLKAEHPGSYIVPDEIEPPRLPE
jgi:hypothetical protein